jgi:hypothetical protein
MRFYLGDLNSYLVIKICCYQVSHLQLPAHLHLLCLTAPR